jgi:hypothetical protein
MAKRKRSKSRKRASVRRRSYPVRSTRKGARRVSARRAYMKTAAPTRRRARRNPKGIFSSPAVRYSLAASAGFAAASYADTWTFLNPIDKAGNPVLPFGIKGSVLASVITLVVAEYGLKGTNKQYARAAAVGMLAPTAIGMIQEALDPKKGGAMHNLPPRRNVHRIAASKHSATNFANASRSLDRVPA